MKHLLKTILYLTLTISFFACKKPKKGEYEMKLTSHSGSVTTLTCDITKKMGLWYITERTEGLSGTMDFYEMKLKQKAFYCELNSKGMTSYNGDYSQYKLTGTSSRKKLSGTYEFISSGYNASSGSYTHVDSGTFEMIRQ